MKFNQELPEDVESKLSTYIERVKNIKWFQPSKDLKKENVEKQVNIVLEGFGVKAGIEYRLLKTTNDLDAAWGAAWDAAWGAARDAARGAARDAARDAAWEAAWDAAWDAARDAARDAAWDAAWGAADLLVEDIQAYKAKYPNGSFLNIIPLYEMGLYPIGVIDGKFVVAVPASKLEFPDDFN